MTAVEQLARTTDRIERFDDELGAFTDVPGERSEREAKESDVETESGRTRGPLHGVPIGVKQLFDVEGADNSYGSDARAGLIAEHDALVVQRLRAAGAVIAGVTRSHEFGWGITTQHATRGSTRNPWNLERIPGGSSGGSAAAVAAGIVDLAVGTDTGGSIRVPAAFCGIVGLKPTYGRCSRWGIVAFASSLDQAGPIARTVRDSAILLASMAGHDPNDTTSVDRPVPDYEAAVGKSIKGMKIGIPKEYRVDGMAGEIDRLWEQGSQWLAAAGAELVEVSLPHTKYALPAYYIVAPAEASSNLARYDGVRYGRRTEHANDLIELYEKSRAEGFGREVLRRIMIGTYVLSAGYYDAYYLRAQRVRNLIARDFTDVFKRCDILLAPITPCTAFALGEKTADPVSMYLTDVFTVPLNLAGLPGLSVPAGLSSDGLPLGLQVIGKAFDEATVLRAGRALEIAADFRSKPHAWWTAP
jgi:aspartyl-tRNA(Asn)/glutamyl-tRNA(Gln) amidotransferase subunit A